MAKKKTEEVAPLNEEVAPQTEEVAPLTDNGEATLEDLQLTAEDLGIKYAKNSTPEFLIEKIKEAQDENAKDEDGKYFTAIERDCFILSSTFKVDIPYRLDEWENNKEFMIRFSAQIKAGTLKMIEDGN